ncbi:hypothetical protein A3A93_02905 [Candidatus Roizmanbacteria bacterium RIFCSPLOWO2_01_FULL_38_12]|uniref:Uncharacterized protein n=1 Tax=Candidatus Roizmanbacteria bacterium RIFCSPLOWO2_01_FULL_38_12 TaxID=1802061 RepID=A0A1F7IZG8_9BACT|nr:MAG: hypothetical protein A3F59_05995 [Candidatus Roizmanbacteria bacterium RIFCSPHIGHO2_12_FULL_38_13]OGK48756.1 MAG: hypothetical protein A3A93_02905 [Candidatus Roizmanbacteria bacterium RIFCSPLOWO2_01_FULL_38_12]
MEKKSYIFNFIHYVLIIGFIFLFPLFFLPITREFLIYSKFYFLILFALLLLFVSLSKFIFTKKVTWATNPSLQPFLLIILAYVLSIILVTPNKIQAIFRPQYGLVMIISMIVFYLYSSYFLKKTKVQPALVLSVSGLFVAIISMIMMVDPFQKINLPSYWSFLKNNSFNTIGSSFDLVSFLLFIIIGASLYIWRIQKGALKDSENKRIYTTFLGVTITAAAVTIAFTLYTVIQSMLTEGTQVILPPLNLSWFAALEILKNPLTAVFGVGVDNFGSLFTQVRNPQYNLTSLWQVSSFASSRSAILHIFTELGLLGLVGFGLLIYYVFKDLNKTQIETKGMFITSLALLFLLPPSLINFFLFFASMAFVVADVRGEQKLDEYEVDLSKLVPAHIGLSVLGFLFIGSSIYFVGRNFLSELYFKRSIDAISENSLQKLYQNQQQAVQYNPYSEEFRRNFSQANLLVANNLAAKAQTGAQLTEQERTAVTQSLQISINEAKAAVALNPARVTNWQNLAGIYRQILNAVQQAPVWTIASYQQAISLDRYNPVLRLELGSVFYLLQDYESAQRLFEQAVSLKPDWANSHYNLAWAYYQNGNYRGAVQQMQVVIGLVDPARAEDDYKKAQDDLKTFQQKYDEQIAQQQATETTEEAPTQELNLPTPPPAAVEPKLELPKESSPGATVER